MKIFSIVGTRPEAIKMAPVIHELARRPDQFESVVCSTGQHREMLDQAFAVFDIRPDLDLGVMTANQSLAGLTARLFEKIDVALGETSPDWVLAQGDTTTVMVAALCSFYRKIKFGHVEAGLRTGDKMNPFPEEMNRLVADRVADLMFAPTEQSRTALLAEGIAESRIFVTGNTVIDAMFYALAKPYDFDSGPLAGLPLDRDLVVVTSHRRESFGDTFRGICAAIKKLSETFPEKQFLFPVHLNPNVRGPVFEILDRLPNVSLLEPLDYLSLQNLMRRAQLILTDSGGIQEEAPSLNVPVLVMRESTERPEGVAVGAVKLIGTNQENIVAAACEILTSPDAHRDMAEKPNPYGDGTAAKQIVDALAASI